ncbi:alkaline phosphatase family protein [Nocardioides sp. W7]|uniref:alkaline phosphatase family protein n=1 Tax=Nocardioides sp. W7 TaxID=2931390 RepID=UPI001FD024EA|nr:alkaline phosphatase family protein [Nocardioides sp. W7]
MRSSAALVLTATLVLTGGAVASGPAIAIPEPFRARTTTETPAPVARADAGARVLAISVDGLNPAAIRRLGPTRAPVLTRLLAEGAATLNARSSRELTITLPNHTTMVTGRRIAKSSGGHGVTWNDDLAGRTVHGAAEHRVSSVFSVVARAGGESAVFAGKTKFSLFDRSWPAAVDRSTIDTDPVALVRAARADLRRADRELTFLHLALPDKAGHDAGFMSTRYLDEVARTDRLLGRVVRTIERTPALAEHLTLVLTADHGGRGADHGDRMRLANYRIPFVVWGAGVTAGDLYALNPQRADPGHGRPSYDARRQPVRNGDLANLVTGLLGLPAVPGSEFDDGQDLVVR